MNNKKVVAAVLTLMANALTISTNANSIGFDQVSYSGGPEISVILSYDFTDFPMVGGSVDIEYDPNAILFVGFTRAPFASDVDAPASPSGSLISPGLYSGVGLGVLNPFFGGINSAGAIGTFTFEILGDTDLGATSCGFTLCVLPNDINPLLSLPDYKDVSDELIANGIGAANVFVPLPAAAWLLLSGIIGLIGCGRRG